MEQVTGKKSLRTDFVLLLHLCIIGLFYAGWLVFALIMSIQYGGLDPDEYFYAFGIPLVLATFLGVMAVALSNVLRQKWWIAIIGTILLLGTPLVAWVITWIGKQIARFFYLATPEDLAKTRLVLNMKVKPRKGKMLSTQEAESNAYLAESMPEMEVKSEKVNALMKETAAAELPPVLPRYFGLWQTTIAALFGGVLAGGLLISLNYRNLKEKTSFFIALVIGIIGQFVLLVINAGFSYSDSHLLIMIPVIIAIPVSFYIWMSELQNEDIKNDISSHQGNNRSWWWVIGIIVLSWIFIAVLNPLAEEIVWALDIPFI